jgi:regulation of enolase protein 1 (concanavalin A-like superfamily)
MPIWVNELMLSEPIRQWLKYEVEVENEMQASGSVREEDICDWCSGVPCRCDYELEQTLTGARDAEIA